MVLPTSLRTLLPSDPTIRLVTSILLPLPHPLSEQGEVHIKFEELFRCLPLLLYMPVIDDCACSDRGPLRLVEEVSLQQLGTRALHHGQRVNAGWVQNININLPHFVSFVQFPCLLFPSVQLVEELDGLEHRWNAVD